MTRVALVTGGSRGIGAAVSRLAAKDDYAVCVNYRTGGDSAAQVVEDIRRAGGSAIAVRADVTREDEVADMFETVDQKLGTIYALVNNAGVSGNRGNLADIETAGWRPAFQVNLLGAFYCAREALRRMTKSAAGAIVNVSSTAAIGGGAPGLVPYAASKGGLEAMTVGLAREVAAQGIRVNAVRPGIIADGMDDVTMPLEKLRARVASVPMGRPGTSEEVASAIVWLLSDRASYITGAVLSVAGGR